MDQTDPKSPWYPYVWIDPERLGGVPCFRGTRVPIKNLFDYFEEGLPISKFLRDFPPITREQVDAVVGLAGTTLIKAVAA